MRRRQIIAITLGMALACNLSMMANSANAAVSPRTSQASNSNSTIKKAISDKEAAQMASKALKDFIGKETSFFKNPVVTRYSAKEAIKDMQAMEVSKEDRKVNTENTKKHIANVINITFSPTNKSLHGRNLVVINEETREIVYVTAFYNNDEKLNVKTDDSKVKSAISDFLKKNGKSLSNKTVKVQKTSVYGQFEVICQLSDGREASIFMNAKSYEVIGYKVNYNKFIKLPSRVKEEKKNFKDLLIK
ncbi:hypothetical protein [Paenibacillus glycinis]|uniref:Uncharacterized protein n=1 Tax=Paenibacillus glycinis TaxID=2697035 RepID=A0ABW9XWD4_9BACL|nr:hypothetical protein [Paenibacillus glycinis]NBD27022.1 hypothetical protein [Paenibacillus glycinis]